MDKKNFKPLKIMQAMFIFRYHPYADIERLMLDFEKGLKSLFDNRATPTRVSENANPQVPRFVMQNNSGKKLEVSLVEARLLFTTPIDSIEKASTIIEKNVNTIFTFLNDIEEINLSSFNVFTKIVLSLKQKDTVIREQLFRKFIKLDVPNDLIKSSIMFEIKKDEMVHKYVIGHYLNEKISYAVNSDELKRNSNNRIFLSVPTQREIIEKGISIDVIIDTENNEEGDTKELFKNILVKFKNEIKSAPQRFIFSETSDVEISSKILN